MTLQGVRVGLVAFVALSCGVAANLLLFQRPVARTLADKTAIEFGLKSAGDIRTGSLAAFEAATAAGKPTGDARTAASTSRAADEVEVVRAIQRELQSRGYETGSVDGVPGLVTRASIMAYEYDHGFALTGEASEDLLKRIVLGAAAPEGQKSVPGVAAGRSAHAEQIIRTVQQSLQTLGYAPIKADGRLGEATVRAIREFEADQKLPETGRVSGALVARLARLAGQGRLATPR